MSHARGGFVRLLLPLAMMIVLSAAAAGDGVARGPVAGTPDDVVRLPDVVADGTPRGLVTVVIAVPAELRDEPDITYEVRTSAPLEVLGRLSGTARIDGDRARPIVLTLRVPAGADAGQLEAAEVIFRARGREYLVPVVLRVPVVRSARLTGARELRDLRTGDRLLLPYRVTNAGNAADTLLLEVRGPSAWRAQLQGAAHLVVPARDSVDFDVQVLVPPTANVGDHSLAVRMRDAATGEERGVIHTTLGVIGRAGQVAGLVLRPSLAFATSSSGSASQVGAVLSGPVGNGMQLRAQLSPRSDDARRGMPSQGLSSVGATPSSFAASLATDRWSVSAGNTGMQLSELAGVNLMGQGVIGQLDGERYDGRAIVARSTGASHGGRLLGAGLWRETTHGRFGGQVSALTEQRGVAGAGNARELTAVGVDYLSPLMGTVRVGGGAAHRAMADATGIGFTLNATHERPLDRVTLSVTHAPGGSEAFARSIDEWQLSGARVLTDRWSVDAYGQHSHDAGALFRGMDVTSWSVGQRYALQPDVSLHLRGQSSQFRARAAAGGIGDFGAGEYGVLGGAEWGVGPVSLNAEASMGTVTRSAELLGGRVHETAATKRGVRMGAVRVFDTWGTLDGNASIESTEAGVGIPGTVLATSVRWSGIPLAVAGRQLRLNTEASYQRLGDMQTALVTRASLVMNLPWGLDLAMSAERNPFFRDAEGRAGWIGALRVSAATRIFTPKALGPEGMVFEDRDLNGRRDAGEPGVEGVIVRRGEARATTDRDGRYRLPVRARGRTRIDQGTLPLGLIAHPLLAADTLERLDLPVLPTGKLTVHLDLVPDEGGRVPDVDLRGAIVLLRDASGFEWVGRRVTDTTAVFDGVPSGTYTLRFNFDRLSETLRVQESLPVTVAPHSADTVRVPLRGRAVRIFTPTGNGRRTRGAATR